MSTKAAEAEPNARRVLRLEAPSGSGVGWIDRERSADGISTATALVVMPGRFAHVTLAFGAELGDDAAEALLRAVRVEAREE